MKTSMLPLSSAGSQHVSMKVPPFQNSKATASAPDAIEACFQNYFAI
jgi:hypothetical protein